MVPLCYWKLVYLKGYSTATVAGGTPYTVQTTLNVPSKVLQTCRSHSVTALYETYVVCQEEFEVHDSQTGEHNTQIQTRGPRTPILPSVLHYLPWSSNWENLGFWGPLIWKQHKQNVSTIFVRHLVFHTIFVRHLAFQACFSSHSDSSRYASDKSWLF